MKSELINAIRLIKNSLAAQDKYVNSLDYAFSTLILDNPYNCEQSEQIAVLLDALFGDLAEDVMWFLYEFEAGSTGPHVVLHDGTEHTFFTNEDYYEYLQQL